MAKSLTIKFMIDNAQARAANRQMMADFAAQSKAAEATANAQTRASNRVATAAVASNKKVVDSVSQRVATIDRIESKYIADDYRRRVRREQQAIASDAAETKRKERKAERETQIAQRKADAQLRADERAAAAATRQLERTIREGDRAAAAQERAAARRVAAAQRAADKQAKADQRATDRAEREAQRKADAEARAAERKQAMIDRIESKYIADDLKRQARRERTMQAAAAKEIALANRVAMMKTQAILRSAKAEQGATNEAKDAVDGLVKKVQGVAIAYLGIQAAVGAYRSIVDITNEAAEAARNHAMETLKVRDSLRELAAIKGQSTPGDEELRRYTDARKSSGLSHEEQVTFSTELFNALGTVSEKKLSSGEREKITTQGGQLAARLGGGQEGAKARATVLGLLPNYLQGKGGKPLTAEDVIGNADAAEMILGRGAGSQTNSATQYQKVLTILTSEGLQGQFKNPLKAAGLTAIASKFGPESAATNTMQAVRETNAITKFRQGEGTLQAQAEALKSAGITEFMDPEQRLVKLFEYIDKETKGGTTEAIPAFLKRRGFQNAEGTEAIGKFFSEYKAGNFQEIMGLADQNVDNAAPLRKFREFAASKTGRKRLADAQKDAAVIEAGKPEENLEIARTRGEADAIEKGMDQKFATRAGIFLHGLARGSQSGAWNQFYEERGNSLRAQELGVAPSPEPIGLHALRGSAPFMGPIGPLLAPAIKSWTGFNQAEANRLEDEAKAQSLGLGGPQGGGGGANMGPVVQQLKQLNQAVAKPAPPRPLPAGKAVGQPRRP